MITNNPQSFKTEASSTPRGTSLPAPTPAPVISDAELIRAAMAQKHAKDVSEVNLSVKSIIGSYADGGVTFSGEMGGGWWLAAKTSGEWEIVADGNGTVMCDSLEDYSFPVSMVPECWDEATSKLIKF